MGVFKKNNKWWIDYYFNGERIRKPISKYKKEAEKALIKIKSDKLHNRYAIPKNEKIKFSNFSMKYIKECSRPTKKSYKSELFSLKNLMVHFGDLYLHEITNYHYEKYRKIRLNQKAKTRDKLISKATINREGALLRGILNKAVEWGFLSFNPITKMKMFKEEPKERILTEKEIDKLVSYANIPLKHIILIAINTGLRIGEILNLEWIHVNLEQKFITITPENAKSKKMRRVPLNNSMMELLSKLQLIRAGSQYMFTNPKTGKPFTTIKTAWKSLLKRAGIEDFRFHDLRHCFATYALLKGGDLISLKETLGHAHISTTSRYTKALMEGQQKLVKGFEVSENTDNIIELKKASSG